MGILTNLVEAKADKTEFAQAAQKEQDTKEFNQAMLKAVELGRDEHLTALLQHYPIPVGNPGDDSEEELDDVSAAVFANGSDSEPDEEENTTANFQDDEKEISKPLYLAIEQGRLKLVLSLTQFLTARVNKGGLNSSAFDQIIQTAFDKAKNLQGQNRNVEIIILLQGIQSSGIEAQQLFEKFNQPTTSSVQEEKNASNAIICYQFALKYAEFAATASSSLERRKLYEKALTFCKVAAAGGQEGAEDLQSSIQSKIDSSVQVWLQDLSMGDIDKLQHQLEHSDIQLVLIQDACRALANVSEATIKIQTLFLLYTLEKFTQDDAVIAAEVKFLRAYYSYLLALTEENFLEKIQLLAKAKDILDALSKETNPAVTQKLSQLKINDQIKNVSDELTGGEMSLSTPMMQAVREGLFEAVVILLRHGIKIDETIVNLAKDAQGSRRNPPLILLLEGIEKQGIQALDAILAVVGKKKHGQEKEQKSTDPLSVELYAKYARLNYEDVAKTSDVATKKKLLDATINFSRLAVRHGDKALEELELSAARDRFALVNASELKQESETEITTIANVAVRLLLKSQDLNLFDDRVCQILAIIAKQLSQKDDLLVFRIQYLNILPVCLKALQEQNAQRRKEQLNQAFELCQQLQASATTDVAQFQLKGLGFEALQRKVEMEYLIANGEAEQNVKLLEFAVSEPRALLAWFHPSTTAASSRAAEAWDYFTTYVRIAVEHGSLEHVAIVLKIFNKLQAFDAGYLAKCEVYQLALGKILTNPHFAQGLKENIEAKALSQAQLLTSLQEGIKYSVQQMKFDVALKLWSQYFQALLLQNNQPALQTALISILSPNLDDSGLIKFNLQCLSIVLTNPDFKQIATTVNLETLQQWFDQSYAQNNFALAFELWSCLFNAKLARKDRDLTPVLDLAKPKDEKDENQRKFQAQCLAHTLGNAVFKQWFPDECKIFRVANIAEAKKEEYKDHYILVEKKPAKDSEFYYMRPDGQLVPADITNNEYLAGALAARMVNATSMGGKEIRDLIGKSIKGGIHYTVYLNLVAQWHKQVKSFLEEKKYALAFELAKAAYLYVGDPKSVLAQTAMSVILRITMQKQNNPALDAAHNFAKDHSGLSSDATIQRERAASDARLGNVKHNKEAKLADEKTVVAESIYDICFTLWHEGAKQFYEQKRYQDAFDLAVVLYSSVSNEPTSAACKKVLSLITLISMAKENNPVQAQASDIARNHGKKRAETTAQQLLQTALESKSANPTVALAKLQDGLLNEKNPTGIKFCGLKILELAKASNNNELLYYTLAKLLFAVPKIKTDHDLSHLVSWSAIWAVAEHLEAVNAAVQALELPQGDRALFYRCSVYLLVKNHMRNSDRPDVREIAAHLTTVLKNELREKYKDLGLIAKGELPAMTRAPAKSMSGRAPTQAASLDQKTTGPAPINTATGGLNSRKETPSTRGHHVRSVSALPRTGVGSEHKRDVFLSPAPSAAQFVRNASSAAQQGPTLQQQVAPSNATPNDSLSPLADYLANALGASPAIPEQQQVPQTPTTTVTESTQQQPVVHIHSAPPRFQQVS